MTEQTHAEQNDSPHLTRLAAWASNRGFEIAASSGSQREPGHIVAVKRGDGGFGSTIISRESQDSVDTAAMYLLNALELLGVEGLPR